MQPDEVFVVFLILLCIVFIVAARGQSKKSQ